jgi:hypothetical protein
LLASYVSDKADQPNWGGQTVPGRLFINLVQNDLPPALWDAAGSRKAVDQAVADAKARSDEWLVSSVEIGQRPGAVLRYETAAVTSYAVIVPVNSKQLIEVRSPNLPAGALQAIAEAVVVK